MVRVRRLKPGEWVGHDYDHTRLRLSGEGSECEMSAERAELLCRVFPSVFEVVGVSPGERMGTPVAGMGDAAPTIAGATAPADSAAGPGEPGTGSAPATPKRRGRRK